MKSVFKPLGIATAVAAASAAQAQVAPLAVSSKALGDLAIVPYYTVATAGDNKWVTAVHVVNTSDATQVVKFRFRRATDSMDALDFNIVMSPEDVFAGYLTDNDGTISFRTSDTTCTVPHRAVPENGGERVLEMPAIYRPGAETGYVEIIAMGQPVDENQPIAVDALHALDSDSGLYIPNDCVAVAENFRADGDGTTRAGIVDFETSWQVDGGVYEPNSYADSGNVLKVSYAITDVMKGIEFGDNAVHIENFLAGPSMTNQQYGYFSGDLNGFDFPDLNGAEPVTAPPAERGKFTELRSTDVLGVTRLANEWSSNAANGVATDWVVTLPGQYNMIDLPAYLGSLTGTQATGFPWFPTLDEDGQYTTNTACPRGTCDYRDMPVTLVYDAYNREEFLPTDPEDGLTVSPAPPGVQEVIVLPKEANLISFGDSNGFLSAADVTLDGEIGGQQFGWLTAGVESRDPAVGLCDWDGTQDSSVGDSGFPGAALGQQLTQTCVPYTPANVGGVPMVGFAAWSRNLGDPSKNYGRIIAHSSIVS